MSTASTPVVRFSISDQICSDCASLACTASDRWISSSSSEGPVYEGLLFPFSFSFSAGERSPAPAPLPLAYPAFCGDAG